MRGAMRLRASSKMRPTNRTQNAHALSDVSNAVRVGQNSVFGGAKDTRLNANLFVLSAANGLDLLLETRKVQSDTEI